MSVPIPLPAIQRQRVLGWVAMLDVDLGLAQQMLRLAPAAMPLPPIALPAVLCPWTGEVLAAAVEAPSPEEVLEPEAPVAVRRPLGAYARRARKG